MLMGLNYGRFLLIKSGIRIIGIGLNDFKLSALKVDNNITFIDIEADEKITVVIKYIYKLDTFKELYSQFSAIQVVRQKSDSIDKMVVDGYTTYSSERCNKLSRVAFIFYQKR
ncbi:hypothetical protein [Leuconostoc mesenteroides]|uniref:hypothetical protein n=1 Tax=Leuconostoc mesenteroides TaxID=1245 RepID=UPI000689F263|nr:hypothetical protein [Leuconostoc mesenteroides]